MLEFRIMLKIGKIFDKMVLGRTIVMTNVMMALVLGLAVFQVDGQADGVQFRASVDRNQIALQDAVNLKLVVTSDSNSGFSEPQFSAPDFQVIDSFSGTSVQSSYDSSVGRFETVRKQEVTKVLQPVRTGNFTIS